MMSDNELSDYEKRIAPFWKHFIDPHGTQKTKMGAFCQGWQRGAEEKEAEVPFADRHQPRHTWWGVGYRMGFCWGAVDDIEEQRTAFEWAKKRLHEYGWVEVERYQAVNGDSNG